MKLAGLVFATLVSGTTLLGSPVWAAEHSTLEQIANSKVLTIANSLTSPPWQFRDASNLPAGFSIDLDRMLAKDLGVDLVTIDMDWAGLIPALLTRKSDILATTMSVTPERAKRIAFTSEAWYTTGVTAFMPPAAQVKSWEELNRSGIRVSAKTGTTGVDTARALFPLAELQTYPSDVDIFQAVKTGRADVALNDAETKSVAKIYDLAPVTAPRELITNDPWAFATRPHDDATWAYLNEFLKKIKADGRYAALKAYWVDSEDWKHDYMEKRAGLSDQRLSLIKRLDIQDYVPNVNGKSRASLK